MWNQEGEIHAQDETGKAGAYKELLSDIQAWPNNLGRDGNRQPGIANSHTGIGIKDAWELNYHNIKVFMSRESRTWNKLSGNISSTTKPQLRDF